NSVAVSGGTDLMGYYLSYANTHQDGVIPGDKDKLNRNTLTFKGNGGTEKVKFDFGATYTGKKISAVSTGQGDDAGAGKSIFQEILQNTVDMYIPMFRDYESKFDNLDNYYTPYAQNPYFIVNENGNDMQSHTINSYINFNAELAKGLNLMWRGGLDVSNTFSKRYGAIAKITDGAHNASAQSVAGAVTDEQKSLAQYNSDLILTYNTAFDLSGDDVINFGATIGNNINQIDYSRSTTNSKGLVVPNYYNVANISGSANVSSYEYRKRTMGLYGTLDFDFNSFLFLQLTARNDWSSTLPTDNNSFFYPGVNMGFVFTDLLPDSDAFTYGKLRASYALAGNDAPVHALNAYYSPAYIGAYYGATAYPVGGVAAYEQGNLLGNPNLSPEISTEIEFGGDFRFFNNRLGLDVAYYKKVTDDLIMQADIASSSGYTAQTTNLGKITNTGIEVLLTGTPVQTDNFNWDMTVVYTKSNTILDELSKELGVEEYVIYSAYQTEFVAIPGEQLGQFRIPDYKRNDAGQIIVGDNGLPLEGDKINYASSVPDFKASLGNTFTYKDLSLSFMFDYQKGGYMYSYTSSITFWSGNNEQSLTNDRRPYVIPNSVQENGAGGFVENSTPIHNNWHEYYSGNTNRPIESTRIIEKTYLKLRDASLSYNLTKVAKKIGLDNASVSIFGRNLFLWTPASNSFVDPETSTYGNDLRGMFGEFGGAPSTRSYGMKLNLSF
ncbi:MAG: TonB-dependent receptor, partial [Flavobacteriales bacterium]|nr:TonB-dependent receptor [Flavobacteriales bacterium]